MRERVSEIEREAERAIVSERDKDQEWITVRRGRGKQRVGERSREDPETHYTSKRHGQT